MARYGQILPTGTTQAFQFRAMVSNVALWHKKIPAFTCYTRFFFIKSAYPGYKNKTIFSPVKQRTNHIVHISLPKGLSNALVIYRSIY